MSYFYGPVPSRRLGFSLGVDLILKKTCSFECLYCQLGKGKQKSTRRFSIVNLIQFRKELKRVIRTSPRIDYITISGSGEPTLHKNLDKIITTIKTITRSKYPVCVVTNSSLLHRKDVRKELSKADLIIPSLDAATATTFHKINRPDKTVVFERIIKGLIALRKEFKGKIWLEIMLVKGVNDTIKEAIKFKEIINKIKPDKVQLNLPVRPSAVKTEIPANEKIRRIKSILNDDIEVVAKFNKAKRITKISSNLDKMILKFLQVRPASLEDLIKSLAGNPKIIAKQLNQLIKNGKIKTCFLRNKKYFIRND